MHSRPPIDALFFLAAVAQTGTQVAEIALPLDRAPDYKSTTVSSIIVPAIMTYHCNPALQFPVGITINEKNVRHQCLLGQQTAEFLIRPLAPQGLRYPRNVYGFSGQPTGMSRSHAENVLRLSRKDMPLCSFHPLLSLQLHSPRRTGAFVLLRTTTLHPAEDVPTLQEPPPDRGLSVRNDNPRTAELHLAPGAVVDRLPSLDPETSPSLKTTMHAESDALPQDAKVAQSRLDSSVDMISIGSYGKTNLISPASTVDPGTTPIWMKQRPLNLVKKESLWRQVDQRVEQRVVEEVYLPWSFPLAPVLKRNSREVRWAIAYRRMNAIPREDVSSPDYRHVPQGWPIYDLGTDDHGSLFSRCFLFFPVVE